MAYFYFVFCLFLILIFVACADYLLLFNFRVGPFAELGFLDVDEQVLSILRQLQLGWVRVVILDSRVEGEIVLDGFYLDLYHVDVGIFELVLNN